MKITCPHCGKIIELQQQYLYHAGFSNLGFLYCDTCSNILEFGSYNPNYETIVGNKHPWVLTPEEKTELESHLAPCPCGGHFKFNAYPRCPFCGEDLSSLLPDNIRFFEIGQVVDGDKDQNVWLMNVAKKIVSKCLLYCLSSSSWLSPIKFSHSAQFTSHL